ncbi:CAP domain-containing protein [Flavivirga jejuensis]|uniref:CAP domain-containing protein n=1 Tax=Flavivirga jejuensis TaxID=870487 RepID=A0ABT8WQ55_9FLAO|nr:CAP domain-containing protein [Flavivirga jejuensis]MDO5975284.1 CAP domain-containing protein [Flavivirga jejuensis]
MKSYKWLLVIFLQLLFLSFSCSKDDSPQHGTMIDLGIDDDEVLSRLTTSLVGGLPDGDGNPENLCNNGEMQLMVDDPYCGYVDVGEYGLNQINEYRSMHGLPPYVRAIEYELCAAREARLAVENDVSHWSDGCGWKSQGAAGGGRGGDTSNGTVEKSIWWVPKLFYEEGPDGGHYQAMMEERSRAVAIGYYAIDRDRHGVVVNYYDSL